MATVLKQTILNEKYRKETKKGEIVCCTEEYNGGAVWSSEKKDAGYKLESFHPAFVDAIEAAVKLAMEKDK